MTPTLNRPLSPACRAVHDALVRDGYRALLDSHCVLLDIVCDLIDITAMQQDQLEHLAARLARVDNLLDLPAVPCAAAARPPARVQIAAVTDPLDDNADPFEHLSSRES